MNRSEKIREAKLTEIEGEFQPLLISCLRECARGRWGLFGQNSILDPQDRYRSWPEARRLRELAGEIQSLRRDFGQVNEDCEHFLRLWSLRGPNIPGEPKLALEFLSRLDQSDAN